MQQILGDLDITHMLGKLHVTLSVKTNGIYFTHS